MWLCIEPRLEFNIEVGGILKNKRLHRYKYLCSKCKSCNFSIHLSYTLIRVKKMLYLLHPMKLQSIFTEQLKVLSIQMGALIFEQCLQFLGQ